MSVGTPASVRECGICEKVKPLVAFTTYRDRKGQARRLGICKKCREERASTRSEELREWRKNYSKKYNKKNRSKKAARDAARRAEAKAFVDAFKEANPCLDCKRKFPAVAMDLDHVRGNKIRNVASLVGGAYRLDLIKAEIEKCDLICACCHRIRTAKRGENRSPTRSVKSINSVPRVSLSNKKLITMNGETRSIAEWERRLGLPKGIGSYRLRQGYSPEEAFAAKTYNLRSSPARSRREASMTPAQKKARAKVRSEIARKRHARKKAGVR